MASPRVRSRPTPFPSLRRRSRSSRRCSHTTRWPRSTLPREA
jgi:hypothetical protein